MLKLFYLLQARVQAVELGLSLKIEKKLAEPYGASIFYFGLIISNLLLVFYQILFDLLKFVIILTRDPGVSFNVFFKQRELRSCPFSYHTYKNIQQRVRMFSLAGVAAMVIVAVTSSLVTNLLFGGKLPGRAALYSFSQTSWTATSTDNITHNVVNGPPSDWANYAAKDSYLSASSSIQLSVTASSTTQTSSSTSITGFLHSTASSTYALSNAVVDPASGDAKIGLATTSSGFTFTQTDNSSTTPSQSAATGGFNNVDVSSATYGSNIVVNGSGVSASILLSLTPPAGGGGGSLSSNMLGLGMSHTCAIKTDGSLWCWGYDGSGQIGNGATTGNITLPSQIISSGVASIDSGSSHTCAIKTDGSLWCWGIDTHGQIGNGATSGDVTAPSQIISSGVASVGLSSNHTCAIKTDGSLWCWGYDASGQIGNGATSGDVTAPSQIISSGVASVGSASSHSCAIKTDGSLWCWGSDYYGQIGNGATSGDVTAPSQIISSGVASVGLGDGHTCAIKTDGSLWCWGSDSSGQIGNGATTGNVTAPSQIISSDVASVGLGNYHSCAIKTDGSLWCWGSDSSGQLGDSSTSVSITPAPVLASLSGSPIFTGGFESGTLPPFTVQSGNWSPVSGTGNFNSGSYGAKSSGTNGAGALRYQTSLDPNQKYAISFYAKKTGADYANNGYCPVDDSHDCEPPDYDQCCNWVEVLDGSTASFSLDGTSYSWVNGFDWTNYSYSVGYASNTTLDWNYTYYGGSVGGLFLDDVTVTPITGPVFDLDGSESATYTSPGYYISHVDGGAAAPVWDTFKFTRTVTDGGTGAASTTFRVRSGASSTIPPADIDTEGCAIADSASGATTTLSSACAGSGRYLWYKATLTSGDGSRSPQLDDVIISKTSYVASGDYTSAIMDLGKYIASWGNASWTVGGSGTTTVKVRSCDDASCSSSGTNDESALKPFSFCNSISNNSSLADNNCITAGDRYLQYQVSLQGDTDTTPTLNDITFNYSYYPTTQTLTSSKYDTTNTGNTLNVISWDENVANLPANTTVTISLRGAVSAGALDGAGWQDFTNSTSAYGCTKAGTVVTCNNLPSTFRSSPTNQWFQYKIALNSTDGRYTPTVNDVNVTYNINFPPQFDTTFGPTGSGSQASQIATSTDPNWGKVKIEYKIKDPDADVSTVPNQVTPSFEYNIGGGWQAITGAYLSANATSSKAVDKTSWNTYTAYWDAHGQTPNTVQPAAQVRITINDGMDYNNSSSSIASFALDTRAPSPVGTAFSVDASSTTAVVSLNFTDNTDMLMKVGLAPDLSDVSSWTDYSSSYSINSASSTVYAQIVDAYGNTSSIVQITPPNAAANVIVQDISSVSGTPTYRELLLWDAADSVQPSGNFVRYNVYRSTNNVNFSLLSTSSIATNYSIDTNPPANTLVYYKITILDDAGNVSPAVSFSAKANGTQDSDTDESNVGADAGTTPPEISGVTSSSVTASQATISWDTDILSDSLVEYSTDQAIITAGNASSIGLATLATSSHSVTLSNLTASTTYYYRVKSASITGATASSSIGSLVTVDSPRISVNTIATSSVANTSFRVTWQTSGAADSYIVYSASSDLANSVEVGDSTATTTHEVTVRGLDIGTRYYFMVKSGADRAGSPGSYYQVDTTSDTDAPIITVGPATSSLSYAGVIISWKTDEAASSTFRYGTSSLSTLDDSSLASLNINHSANLLNLLSGGQTYNYEIINYDSSNNASATTTGQFVTPNNPDTAGPTIATTTPEATFPTGATISWYLTDEQGSGFVQYATTSNPVTFASSYKEVGQSQLADFHRIILTGLSQGTDYYFRVRSTDSAGNQTIDDNSGNLYSFRTSDGPIISITASSTTDNSFSVTWQTTNPADSQPLETDAFLIYSADADFTVANEIGVGTKNDSNHQLTIDGLQSGTPYYFRLRSTDSVGAVTTYPAIGSLTFTTGNTAPQIIGAVVQTITATPSIILSWVTNKDATSTISYSQEGSGVTTTVAVNEAEPTTSHFFDLGGLTSAVRYYYQITLRDLAGNVTTVTPLDNESQPDSFIIPDQIAPVISSTTPINTTPTSATIGWQTDENSTSYLQYSTSSNLVEFESNYKEVINETLTTNHSVEILDLEQGTPYYYRVRSTDSRNNQSEFEYADETPTLFSFQTIDGPAIESISVTNIGMTGATISWNTASTTNAIVVYDADYESDNNFGDARQQGEVAFASGSHNVTITGLASGVKYYFKVQSTDENGSARTVFNPASQYFETIEDIQGPEITFDPNTDATDLSNTGVTISWLTHEPATSTVYYATSSDLVAAAAAGQLYQINDKPSNLNRNHQFKLTGLSPNTPYYYKLRSTDQYGNPTEQTLDSLNQPLTFTTQVTPDSEPPRVAGLEVANPSATSVIISWQTEDENGLPEEANSFIQYATSSTGFDQIYKEVGRNELSISHSVQIDNLEQGRTYYFRVRSEDEDRNRNVQAQLEQFSTIAGPIINVEDVDYDVPTETGVTISWTTASSSDSYVTYDLNEDFSAPKELGNPTATTSHAVKLTGLTPDTVYYFKVRSKAANGAATTLSHQSFTFRTYIDTVAPNIIFNASSDVVKVTDNSVSLAFKTSELARPTIVYGTSPETYLYSTSTSNYNIDQAFILTGLATSTTYYFKLSANDLANNASTSPEYSFSTLGTQISEAEAKEIEDALKAELEVAKQQLNNTASSSLSQVDSLKKQIEELEKQLTTAKQQSGGGIVIIDKTDRMAPSISNVKAIDIKADSATLTWTTNEEADSFVEYSSGGSSGNFGNWKLATNHSAILNNLKADSNYAYKVASRDSSGNLAVSPDYSFTTPSLVAQLTAEGKTPEEIKQISELEVDPPENKEELLITAAKRAMEIVSSVAGTVSLGTLETTLSNQFDTIEKLASAIPAPIFGGEPGVSTTAYTATIAWRTDKDANSLVSYAPEDVYSLSRNEKSYLQTVGDAAIFGKTHLVKISGLKPDTTYHYQLRGKAEIGPEGKSRDFTFKTKPEALEISNYAVQDATVEKAIFKWITTTETDSELTYIPYRNGKLNIDETKTLFDKTLTTIHEIAIDKFEAGVMYQVVMAGTDQKGAKTEKTIETFSTSEDDLPPIISQVQTESALSQGKQMKVQTVISWLTNEPTIGQVMYEKGVITGDQEFKEKTTLETTYGRKHVAIITKFEPGAVYTFRVTATDSGGNTTTSKTFTILTPRQKESVFQLILKNFESTFGWVSKIK